MERKTILHVTTCFAGGVSRAIASIAQSTPEYVHVLLYGGAESTPDFSSFARTESFARSRLSRWSQLNRVLCEVRPAVVHSHSSWAGFLTRVVPIGAPVLYQPHCFVFDDPNRLAVVRRTYRFVEKLLAKNGSGILALTPHEYALAKDLAPRKSVHHVVNAPSINSALWHAKPTTRPHARVVMIGRLARQKSPEYFVAVAAEVWKRRQDVRFVWIGDGSPEYRQQLEAVGIEVTGWLGETQLVEELRQAAVYLHTASYEGFPLSILDAAACGVPIVARNIPALSGCDVAKVDSAQEAALEIQHLLTSDAAQKLSISRNEKMLEAMNPREQRRSILNAYDAVLREASCAF